MIHGLPRLDRLDWTWSPLMKLPEASWCSTNQAQESNSAYTLTQRSTRSIGFSPIGRKMKCLWTWNDATASKWQTEDTEKKSTCTWKIIGSASYFILTFIFRGLYISHLPGESFTCVFHTIPPFVLGNQMTKKITIKYIKRRKCRLWGTVGRFLFCPALVSRAFWLLPLSSKPTVRHFGEI